MRIAMLMRVAIGLVTESRYHVTVRTRPLESSGEIRVFQHEHLP